MNPASFGVSGWNCSHGAPLSSVCTWGGVLCSSGVVTGINLSGKGLRGTVPSSISQLSALSYLSLAVNSLHGTIPSTLAHLSRLSSLDMHSNAINGTLPSSLNVASSLTTLLLQHTSLSGSLPTSLCSASISSLDFAATSMTCYDTCFSTISNLTSGAVPVCNQSNICLQR